MNARRSPFAAGVLAAALALGGCAAGADDQPSGHGAAGSEPAAAPANSADIMFAQMMIPHHEQALVMSEIVLDEPGLDAEVAALAEQIRDAQAPEIAQLEDWLEEWGEPREAPAGHAHGMDGMLSEAQLAELEAADAEAASTRFLEQMIAHHEGAVSMAEEHLAAGAHEGALALSQRIVDGQSAEIERMRELLGG